MSSYFLVFNGGGVPLFLGTQEILLIILALLVKITVIFLIIRIVLKLWGKKGRVTTNKEQCSEKCCWRFPEHCI